MKTRPDGSLPVIGQFTCEVTGKCKNDKCFWRQRDQFGRNPWWVNYEDHPEEEKKSKDLTEKYGLPEFPQLHIITSTNVLSVSCDGYVE